MPKSILREHFVLIGCFSKSGSVFSSFIILFSIEYFRDILPLVVLPALVIFHNSYIWVGLHLE